MKHEVHFIWPNLSAPRSSFIFPKFLGLLFSAYPLLWSTFPLSYIQGLLDYIGFLPVTGSGMECCSPPVLPGLHPQVSHHVPHLDAWLHRRCQVVIQLKVEKELVLAFLVGRWTGLGIDLKLGNSQKLQISAAKLRMRTNCWRTLRRKEIDLA